MTTWTTAAAPGAAAPDGLPADAPPWVRTEIAEFRQRNSHGLCYRADCGQPLADQVACAAHMQAPGTTGMIGSRAPARAGTGSPTRRRIRGYR